MNVPPALRGFADRHSLEDLALQGCADAFDASQSILACGLLQFRETGNAAFLIEKEDFVRTKAGDR